MTSSTCFRNELRKPGLLHEHYLLPLKRASCRPKISRSPREYPISLLLCRRLTHLLLGLWARAHQSLILRRTLRNRCPASPSVRLPGQHSPRTAPQLGFPVTRWRRPLSGSHLCTENRVCLWRLKKPWKQRNEKWTFLSCFVFNSRRVFPDFKQVHKQKHISGEMDPGEAANILHHLQPLTKWEQTLNYLLTMTPQHVSAWNR